MNRVSSSHPLSQVICICGGHGFPSGTASAARITMIGKALREANVKFHVIHCGPSPVHINRERSGVADGITFEYTTPVKRPNNRIARLVIYLIGVLVLAKRLARYRSTADNTIVYSYVMIGPLNLCIGIICRILGLAMVQELCEWWPGEPTCSSFTKWLYRKWIFKLATGILVISKQIQERVGQRRANSNPNLLVHKAPALVDAQAFASASPVLNGTHETRPMFVYCGTWFKDAFFVIRAFARLKTSGCSCTLAIIGFEPSGRVVEYAREQGLVAEDLLMLPCMDRDTLATWYKSGTALLLPMWNDDRSVTRFPNKICEYLASGRPVVSCHVGELANFLADEVSAYLTDPGDERAFADKMMAVLGDPEKAVQIGAAGQQVCFTHLDYRVYISSLAKFFGDCLAQYQEHHRRPDRQPSQRSCIIKFVRNAFCALLAVWLIACGRVRRSQVQARDKDVVTAIYFHNPREKLFSRCIRWLSKHGYTFISASELMQMLCEGRAPAPGAVWLSFDDACRGLLNNVLPLIRKHHIPITLFVPSGIVAGDGIFPWTRHDSSVVRDALTVAELRQLAKWPEVTLGSHTVNHAFTPNLKVPELRFELEESKRALESSTGTEVMCFAYPDGRFDGREIELLRDLGYRMAATTKNSFITVRTARYFVPRFSVADEISFPEAICNMVGVWRPTVDPLITVLRRTLKLANNAWGESGLWTGPLSSEAKPAANDLSRSIDPTTHESFAIVDSEWQIT